VIEEMSNHQIIHVIIASGTEKPYYIKRKGMSPEGCFTRIGSSVWTYVKKVDTNSKTFSL